MVDTYHSTTFGVISRGGFWENAFYGRPTPAPQHKPCWRSQAELKGIFPKAVESFKIFGIFYVSNKCHVSQFLSTDPITSKAPQQ